MATFAPPSNIVRRYVPNDHECLFTAIAYLCEGSRHGNCGQRLRAICAEKIAADPDMYSEAVLGKPNVQYVEWIKNPFNWGGELEIGILAQHFQVEVAVVMMEALFVLPYAFEGATKRIYLLYTGQHYDPLVGAADDDAPVDGELRHFPVNDNTCDPLALDCARLHAKIAREKASQRTVKKIKCGGCGALLADAQAFQEHCMEVEHDDDFAYDCSDVEVVESGDEPVPEGRIDLTAPDVDTFYDSHTVPFANSFPSPLEVNGLAYPSVEHYWLAMQYAPAAPPGTAAVDIASSAMDSDGGGGGGGDSGGGGGSGLGAASEAFRTAAAGQLNELQAVYQGQERSDWSDENVSGWGGWSGGLND